MDPTNGDLSNKMNRFILDYIGCINNKHDLGMIKNKRTHIYIYIHRTVGEFHQETKIFGSIAGIDPIMAPFFRIQSWRLPTSRARPAALWLPIVEVTGMIC